MSFLKKISRGEEATLRRLGSHHCPTRLYAEAVHESVKQAYVENNEVVPAKFRLPVFSGKGKCGETLLNQDHPESWSKNGERFSYTYQPYGLGWDELCSLVDFCRDHDLVASVDASRSWHFPGWTVLVELKKAKEP